MKKRFYKYYLIVAGLLIIASLNGCIDTFKPTLDKTDTEHILVVEGMITNEPGSFKVKLSRSVPIDTIVNYLNETGAFVTITDDHNNQYILTEIEPGLYIYPDEIVLPIAGRTYQLSIIDAFGSEYESTPVLMEPKPEIKNLYWEESIETVFIDNEVVDQNGINIYVDGLDPQNSAEYYKWEISETWEVLMPNAITALDFYGMPYEAFVTVPEEKKYCWVTQNSQQILIKSVENQSDTKVDKFMVQRIRPGEDKLFIRYSIEVKQYILDNEMYNFWNNIKEINQDAGSLYDKVPVSIFGNISCCNGDKKVLGYFDVAEVAKKRIFIEIGEHTIVSHNKYEDCLYVTDETLYPFTGGFYARRSFCSDCRDYGTNIKPDFW
jgi:hypothetical protein